MSDNESDNDSLCESELQEKFLTELNTELNGNCTNKCHGSDLWYNDDFSISSNGLYSKGLINECGNIKRPLCEACSTIIEKYQRRCIREFMPSSCFIGHNIRFLKREHRRQSKKIDSMHDKVIILNRRLEKVELLDQKAEDLNRRMIKIEKLIDKLSILLTQINS